MKHHELRGIAHNIAASMADGNGFLIGIFGMDVFGEAAKRPDGSLIVDVLNGSVLGAPVSPPLSKAIVLYSEALPSLCERHGVAFDAIEEITVQFFHVNNQQRFNVTVTDSAGRRSTTEYYDSDGKRLKILDENGRVRRKPSRRDQLTS